MAADNVQHAPVSNRDTQALANLDVLRAIAVLCVLISHLNQSNLGPLGGFGVLIFFVHTAFVLMLSLQRISDRPGWCWNFYRQRLFRIYPLSILCVGTMLAFHVPTHMPRSVMYIGANFLLLQNLLKPPSSIIGPLWSLPFEVQMYIVLPFVYRLVRRSPDTIAALIVVSIAFSTAELSADSGLWLTEYVPCFLGGVLAYTRRSRPSFLPAWAWPLTIFLLGTIYLLGGRLLEWPISIALGWLIAWFRDFEEGRLIARVAQLLARYSYGIYLAHIPLIWMCFQREGSLQFTFWNCGAFVLLIIAVPVVTYHLIELPLIRIGKRPVWPYRLKQLEPAVNV
jgi:peptidoglycan/LPS O-acetylase OafA/YrhL